MAPLALRNDFLLYSIFNTKPTKDPPHILVPRDIKVKVNTQLCTQQTMVRVINSNIVLCTGRGSSNTITPGELTTQRSPTTIGLSYSVLALGVLERGVRT